MKYLSGDIFNNALMSAFAELVAVAFSGIIYKGLGLKLSFCLLFVVSGIGGIMILFLGEDSTFWMPFFVLFAKFGISGGFNIVYISTLDVFPTLFCATAIGCCNFFSRFLTIFAPEIAEKEPPLPMILFTAFSLIGIILI